VVFSLAAVAAKAFCSTCSLSGENPPRQSNFINPEGLFSRLDEVSENGRTSWVTIVRADKRILAHAVLMHWAERSDGSEVSMITCPASVAQLPECSGYHLAVVADMRAGHQQTIRPEPRYAAAARRAAG